MTRDGQPTQDTTTMPDSLYARIFEEVAVGIAILEPGTGRFTAVNRAFAHELGYDPAELEGRSLVDLAGDKPTAVSAAMERALDGETETVATVLTDASGAQRQVTLELEAMVDDGEPGLLATLRPVTDEERDTAAEASEQRLEVALAGTNTGVWEWDLASDEVVWTESMERLFGLEPGTFGGSFEHFAGRVHPDDLPAVQEAIETAIERGEMFQSEYRIERDDGEELWVHARGELQDVVDGPGRLVGIVTDITEQKESERALREQERQYRQLVERLPEAHYAIDDEWRFTFCNEPLAERLERPVEEIEGELLWDVLPEVKDSIVEQTFRRVMETRAPESFEYQYESGEHWVSVEVYPYDGGVAAVSKDVSEQRETLRSILDSTPIVVYRFDSDGVFQEVRGEMLAELDLEPDDLLGESIFEVYADDEDVVTAAKRALAGESFRYTLTLGDVTLETQYRPVYTDGEVTSVIGVSTDVTELTRRREQMEFFNSILRHDILNGMTVIKMRAELLADELDGDHARYAQTIVDWCDTTTDITKRVRRVVETLATPEEEHHLEPVDVSAIFRRQCRRLGSAYPEVTFDSAVPDGLRVQADELLSDVLGNVMTNSIEHNDADGLRIETTADVLDETVRVRIADDGVGIADDRKESVFRRGETSHVKETGSGFGLFFVDVMVEKYGGEVWVEDSDGGGACFVVELSRANGG